jgi:hypothetical protein
MHVLPSPNPKQTNSTSGTPEKSKRHQLHLWIGEKDYAFLQRLAGTEDEPVAIIVRRMIRQFRTSAEKQAA